jgi:hypothetical protein
MQCCHTLRFFQLDTHRMLTCLLMEHTLVNKVSMQMILPCSQSQWCIGNILHCRVQQSKFLPRTLDNC